MDPRTAHLIDALAHPGAAVLAALLSDDATEAGLSASVDAPQATVHRRLRRLEDLGLVTRPPGSWRSPNRPYRAVIPEELGALLAAAATASQALADKEERERVAMLANLGRRRDGVPHPRRAD